MQANISILGLKTKFSCSIHRFYVHCFSPRSSYLQTVLLIAYRAVIMLRKLKDAYISPLTLPLFLRRTVASCHRQSRQIPTRNNHIRIRLFSRKVCAIVLFPLQLTIRYYLFQNEMHKPTVLQQIKRRRNYDFSFTY